tara:strand:- start:3752 stop:4402 length:651 start_codon:yes stop_codon:yes gene_type:complete
LKYNKFITVAIDSEASAGGGTQAKLISKHFNLYYLDTGKIYRYIAFLKKKYPKKFNKKFIKSKIKNLKVFDLQNKSLLSEEIGSAASQIAKKLYIRKIVYRFQIKCAYSPPKKFNGSCLDGRDITTKIMPNAMFKFFITAHASVRAKRRFNELKKMKKRTSLIKVLKSIKIRDKSDYQRKHSPLKRTKEQVLINSSNLSKKACFLKIKKIMYKKLN